MELWSSLIPNVGAMIASMVVVRQREQNMGEHPSVADMHFSMDILHLAAIHDEAHFHHRLKALTILEEPLVMQPLLLVRYHPTSPLWALHRYESPASVAGKPCTAIWRHQQVRCIMACRRLLQVFEITLNHSDLHPYYRLELVIIVKA